MYPSFFQPHVVPLEHSAEAEELLLRFLGRVLQWLRTNHARVVNLFRKFDSDNDNMLTAEDFYIGMRMMDVSIKIVIGFEDIQAWVTPQRRSSIIPRHPGDCLYSVWFIVPKHCKLFWIRKT